MYVREAYHGMEENRCVSEVAWNGVYPDRLAYIMKRTVCEF